MFSRHSSIGSNKLEPRTNAPNGAEGAQHRASGPERDSKSVIGNDLRILGKGLKITGRGVLQIDGQIDSDVQAAEVIVGEHGKVTGMVAGQHVLICGEVSGVVCAKTVALTALAKVDGDVHHMSLAIEFWRLVRGTQPACCQRVGAQLGRGWTIHASVERRLRMRCAER